MNSSKKTSHFIAIPALAIISVLPLFGAPTPIPGALANGNAWLQFNPVAENNYNAFNYLIGPYSAGYGGAFQPTISSLNATGDGPGLSYSQLTTVWCVDYQLDVSYGSSYGASLQTLNNVTSPDPAVRYGDLTAVGTSHAWTHDLSDSGLANSNTAQTRYLLAAALISEFDDGNGVASPTQPANDSRNQAIQSAIWYITYNSSYGSGDWSNTQIASSQACSGAFNPNNYMCWVGQAESNIGSVDKNAWAVVSGPIVTAGAAKGTLDAPQSNQYQTFLVQVSSLSSFDSPAPEPSFYGVLALGLGGLFAMAHRKRARAARQN